MKSCCELVLGFFKTLSSFFEQVLLFFSIYIFNFFFSSTAPWHVYLAVVTKTKCYTRISSQIEQHYEFSSFDLFGITIKDTDTGRRITFIGRRRWEIYSNYLTLLLCKLTREKKNCLLVDYGTDVLCTGTFLDF